MVDKWLWNMIVPNTQKWETKEMITIELEDPLKTFDWDGEDVLLTAEQVKEAIEAMGEIEK